MHYLCNISSVTVLSHRRGTIHSIFKIGISRNMKCAYMVSFLRYSHILSFDIDIFIDNINIYRKINIYKIITAKVNLMFKIFDNTILNGIFYAAIITDLMNTSSK